MPVAAAQLKAALAQGLMTGPHERPVNPLDSLPLPSLMVSAALIASLRIDHFGLLRVDSHPLNAPRIIGGVLLIGGVSLIARY